MRKHFEIFVWYPDNAQGGGRERTVTANQKCLNFYASLIVIAVVHDIACVLLIISN